MMLNIQTYFFSRTWTYSRMLNIVAMNKNQDLLSIELLRLRAPGSRICTTDDAFRHILPYVMLAFCMYAKNRVRKGRIRP